MPESDTSWDAARFRQDVENALLEFVDDRAVNFDPLQVLAGDGGFFLRASYHCVHAPDNIHP